MAKLSKEESKAAGQNAQYGHYLDETLSLPLQT